jgi:carbon dioxide concentrating mechanism protein CcmO
MHQLRPQSQRQLQPRSPALASAPSSAQSQAKASRLLEQVDKLSESAVGLVSTQSFPAVVGTADMMLKASGVMLVGYEKTGQGYCTAVVRGRIADVRIAVQAGIEAAEKFEQLVSARSDSAPYAQSGVGFAIWQQDRQAVFQDRINQRSRLSNMSIGLLETRGFPAMVGAADAMLKSAGCAFGCL